MDILDIIIAKSLTPQGQVGTYAAKARQAALDASDAVANANQAIENIETITEQTNINNVNATTALAQANAAISAANTAIENLTLNSNTTVKMYTASGQNEDGTMTQKAITDYVQNEINNLDLEDITNYNNTIINLGVDNAGHIIIVGEDGKPTAGITTESDIRTALIQSGNYTVDDALGIEIDYQNKVFTRTQNAVSKTEGQDFNSYKMYGGRMRCNVADDGTITAFYGDLNYREDGSNGQVMVYQPKFYYQRTPITMTKLAQGNAVKKETIIISAQKNAGFKLHPLFINEDGEVIDYVLLPAYQGSIYDNSTAAYDTTSSLTIDFMNDKLSSIAAAKPIAGSDINQLTVEKAEQLAKNRGTGWHITNMAVESANQMLSMVEFGQPNLQSALEAGIVNIAGTINTNCSSITGSTSGLGNTTGVADSTRNEINGTYTSYNNAGKRAVSYRGVENPWGNLWHFIGGVNIYGSGNDGGGYPYICKNFNYQYDSVTNYNNIGFQLPANHSWISAMGYSNEDYDWVYMPAECSSANSALPVGDSLWTNPILNGINCAVIGGTWESDTEAGPFYYGCDREINYYKFSFGANLMFVPTKNDIYTANINKWNSKMG